MAGDGAARHFDSHDGSRAFQKRNHENAHHIKESMLLFGGLGHVGRDGAD